MATLKRRSKGRRVRGGAHTPDPPSGGRLRAFSVAQGLPSIPRLREELHEMTDVLLGRTPPPFDGGYLTMMEVADAYFARASEIAMSIYEREVDGDTPKGGNLYKFRTGELRTFMEMCKRSHSLGSRRLTDKQFRYEVERTGSEAGAASHFYDPWDSDDDGRG